MVKTKDLPKKRGRPRKPFKKTKDDGTERRFSLKLAARRRRIADMIALGHYSENEIVNIITEAENLKPGTIRKNVCQVWEELRASIPEINIEDVRQRAIVSRIYLLRRMLSRKDLRGALMVLDSMANLQGLMRPLDVSDRDYDITMTLNILGEPEDLKDVKLIRAGDQKLIADDIDNS